MKSKIAQIGNNCCGCRSCEMSCNKNAITMKEMSEGFLFPVVSVEQCVGCHLCEKSCPVLSETVAPDRLKEQKIFAVKNKSSHVLQQSSSGGAFSALADAMLEKGGIVIGAAFDPYFNTSLTAVDNVDALELLRGSKYVQSDTKDSYKVVRETLEAKKNILFSGTPCQVAGLRRFLKKDYESLLTVDFICHGVPSNRLFRHYIKWLEQKGSGKVESFSFRDKRNHGWSTCGTYTLFNGRKTYVKKVESYKDPYYWLFETGSICRESCYLCKWTDNNHEGDLTIADYWGIQSVHKQFNGENGVSALICNTQRGLEAFNDVRNQMEYVESDIKYIIENNGNLIHATQRPALRNSIYSDIEKYNFEYVSRKYIKLSWVAPAIRQITPKNVKKIIKRLVGK